MARSDRRPDPAASTGPVPVYFVILPDTLLLDLAGIAEAFRIANQFSKTPVFASHFVGTQSDIRCSIGLGLSGVEPLPADIEDHAWVVLCGMRHPESAVQSAPVQRVARWLERVITPDHTVCCVCAGALVAAVAGLLDGRQCTSHHDHTAWLEHNFPRARVQQNRIFVRDGNVYTSAGVTSGVDLALMLIAEKAGPVTAARVARDLVVYIRRTGADPQTSVWMAHRNHLHPVVHRAQDAMVAAPGDDWTLASIAKVACVSVRSLSRLFREETGLTPLDYLDEIRLALAHELLATTRWNIERIAARAGFSSALQLRRATRRHGHVAPLEMRRLAAGS